VLLSSNQSRRGNLVDDGSPQFHPRFRRTILLPFTPPASPARKSCSTMRGALVLVAVELGAADAHAITWVRPDILHVAASFGGRLRRTLRPGDDQQDPALPWCKPAKRCLRPPLPAEAFTLIADVERVGSPPGGPARRGPEPCPCSAPALYVAWRARADLALPRRAPHRGSPPRRACRPRSRISTAPPGCAPRDGQRSKGAPRPRRPDAAGAGGVARRPRRSCLDHRSGRRRKGGAPKTRNSSRGVGDRVDLARLRLGLPRSGT
jgi:hypothetical protein